MTVIDKSAILNYIQSFCIENQMNRLSSPLIEGFINQLSRRLDEIINKNSNVKPTTSSKKGDNTK